MILDFDQIDKMLHCYQDDGEDLGEFCDGFYIVKTQSDIFSNKQTVITKIFSPAGTYEVKINTEDLVINKFPCILLSYGVDVLSDKDTAAPLVTYILTSKKQAPIEHTYERLGWHSFNDQQAYLCSCILTKNSGNFSAAYAYPEKIAPCGSFGAWKEGLAPFLHRPEIVLALTIGASATIIPLLKDLNIFSDTPIFALIGRSSSFKTTMLKLMASIFGKPSIGDGIIDTMLDTQNYFYYNLGKKNGFIHCIDDISSVQEHDFSNELYIISSGKSKGRLAPDGTPRKIETWATTMVYTGESSIFDQTNKNGGLYARLIEFTEEWLSKEDDINAFYDTINNNYGVAIMPLINTLLSLSKDDIYEIYSDSLHKLCEMFKPEDGISRRIIERFAILTTTLLILNIAWEVEFSIPPVLDLMKKAYEKNRPSPDPLTDSIEAMKEYILNNMNLFITEDDVSQQKAWGQFGQYNYQKCLWITVGNMEKIAKVGKIHNIKDVQHELADRGFLIRDKTRHYIFKKNIGQNVEMKCYGVYLSNQNTVPSKQPKSKFIRPQHSQAKNLLADNEKEDDS